jgi:peroxiredoxin Q/BCP
MGFPAVGSTVPSFSLHNQDGQEISLQDFKGKNNIVLYFYPKALTPGCTKQACGLREIQETLRQKNVVVFGISPDPVENLKKFIDKHSLNFDLLSDKDHTIAEKYGAWGLKKFMGREFMGILRTTFVIDQDLKLVAVLDKFKTGKHHDVLMTLLEEKLP